MLIIIMKMANIYWALTWALNCRRGRQKEDTEEGGENRRVRGLCLPWLALKMMEVDREPGKGDASRSRNGLQFIVDKKTENRELGSRTIRNWVLQQPPWTGNRFFSRASKKESTCQHLDFTAFLTCRTLRW